MLVGSWLTQNRRWENTSCDRVERLAARSWTSCPRTERGRSGYWSSHADWDVISSDKHRSTNWSHYSFCSLQVSQLRVSSHLAHRQQNAGGQRHEIRYGSRSIHSNWKYRVVVTGNRFHTHDKSGGHEGEDKDSIHTINRLCDPRTRTANSCVWSPELFQIFKSQGIVYKYKK